MTRDGDNGALGRFPEQHEPEALWQPQAWNAFGFTTLVDDPYACDLTLRNDSPVKGLAAGGRDPGCDWSLLKSLTIDAGVRNYPPEQLNTGRPNFALFVEYL